MTSYKVSSGYGYPSKPRKQVMELVKILPRNSSVIDIGAGFGNNARVLLNAGHSVVCTETSSECIKELKLLRDAYEGRLTVIDESVQDLDRTTRYDAVVCTMVLHFLSKDEACDAIGAMQAITKTGGYNVVVNYLKDPNLPQEYIWQLEPGELVQHYQSWDIVSYEETYPYTLSQISTLRELRQFLKRVKGYQAARLIARKVV